MTNLSQLSYFNKRLVRNYELIKKYQAGLLLQGFEVKALLKGAFDLTNGYVMISDQNEAWLINLLLTIPKSQVIVTRSRYKLLLNKEEIQQLRLKKSQLQVTIIPVKLFATRNKIKLEIALARGLKRYQKKKKITIDSLQKRNFEEEWIQKQ